MYDMIKNIYADILSEYLLEIKQQSADVAPIVINRAKFDTRALIIAKTYVQNKIGRTASAEETVQWFETTLRKDCFFARLISRASKDLVNILDRYELPICDTAIGVIYENLLAIETQGYEVIKGQYNRKELGSYYTPKSLAQKLVEKTITEYIKNTSIDSVLSAKIVDFSCGAGIFLVGALKHISYLTNTTITKQLVNNIYAYDVDPIALEIAILNILDHTEDYSLYGILCKNFHHANVLVHSNVSSNNKIDLSRDGYIYHKDLGVDTTTLQKYDIILGNPPWEKIRIEEKSLYRQYIAEISDINFKFDLKVNIGQYSNSAIDSYIAEYIYNYNLCKDQIKRNPFFTAASRGELNTCTLFTYAAYKLLSKDGVLGLVVKSSILTSPINKDFFAKIKLNTQYVYDFINKKKIFNIDCRERFSLLILNSRPCSNISLGMNILNIEDLDKGISTFSNDLLDVLNPDTGMLPNIDSSEDLAVLINIYQNNRVFRAEYPKVKFGRLVHLTNHHQNIDKVASKNNIPIYEGKFFHIFDGRYSGFNDVPVSERYRSKAASKILSIRQKNDGDIPLSRFFIQEQKWAELSKQYNSSYMLAWRSLTSASNARTCIATVLPLMPASQSVQFLTIESNIELLYICCIFSSLVFDYITKCKLSGIDLTQTIINQIPIPPLSKAQGCYITIGGVRNSIDKWLLQIAKLLLMDDKRLDLLLSPIAIEVDFLRTYTRSELFDLMNILTSILYEVSPSQLKVILSKFKEFSSEGEIAKFTNKYTELLNE